MPRHPYNDWEIKYDLLNGKKIDCFQYWNYMRRDMFMSFEDEDAGVKPPFFENMKGSPRGELFQNIKKIAELFIPDGGDRICKADIMFICHGRRQVIDGKLVSIYTDFIEKEFPDSITMQRTGGGIRYRKSLYTDRIFFIDKITTKSYIYKYMKKYLDLRTYKAVRDKVQEDMHEAFRELKDKYSLHVNERDFAERATSLYFYYQYKKPVFERLLDRISPKVIVEVVARSFDSEIINEIAYEKGIQTIELQHGTNSTWYPGDIPIHQLPMWYFSFGDFWSRAINLPIPDGHVISTGFPYQEMMMGEYPKDKWARDGKTVIFLSSRKYGKELSEIAAELKRLMPELNIIYKLHPREYADYKENYPGLEESGIEVISDSRTPLYSLFARCSIQIGVESTAIYEGMSFMLRTFIWDIPMAVNLRRLADSGYAELFSNTGELIDLIERKDSPGRTYDVEDFWKKNALNNIVTEIKKVTGDRTIFRTGQENAKESIGS